MTWMREFSDSAWRAITVLLLAMTLLLWVSTAFSEAFASYPADRLLSVAASVCTGITIVWFLLLLPWFWSGDPAFEGQSPRHRNHFLLAIVWTPAAIVLTPGLLAFLSVLFDWMRGARWDSADLHAPGWWVAMVVAVIFGCGYIPVLQRRVREAARGARICFHCGYSLAEIPDCARCPECGTAVARGGDSR